MLKFEAIIKVYGLTATNVNKKISLDDEDFFAWEIKGLSKDEILSFFTPKQILNTLVIFQTFLSKYFHTWKL